jgi:predicted nuclease of predicted toxin-antitoxin system
MRLLVDAQLPPALSDWFNERGYEAAHVRDELGGQTPDREIAAYVEQYGLILVTKDDDFLLRYPPIRSRLIWLRCGNISNRGLRLWLDPLWVAIETRLNDGDLIIEVR